MRVIVFGLVIGFLVGEVEAVVRPPAGYETQFEPVESESGKLVAYFFVKSGQWDEPRQLWIESKGLPGGAQLLCEYARNASVRFSPDDRFVALNDELGSNITELVLFQRLSGAKFKRAASQPAKAAWSLFRRSNRLATIPESQSQKSLKL